MELIHPLSKLTV